MIDPTASVHPTATVHPTAEVGPYAVILEGADIGARANIGAWAIIGVRSSIGERASIGRRAVTRSQANIGARVTIGELAVVEPEVRITMSHELLSGVGWYAWTATATTFRYGCECHPWAEWTPQKQQDLCVKHGANERVVEELRERVRQCARAFGAVVDGVTAP